MSEEGQPRERPRPITMRDIAVATGVSRSTVSRILNDAPLRVPIAAETRERVLTTARELGYRPNPLARALRGAPTMLLGAIVRDITDPFFAGAIEAVSVEARARNYNIVLGHAHARATEALALATMLEARQVDAILLLGDMGDQPQLLGDLRDTHVPVVALWQGSELDVTPAVNVDNRAGVASAVAHLRALGHRRIAFIGGRLLGDIRERQAAYADAVADLQPLPEGYIRNAPNTPAGGEAALMELMRLPAPPTALIASTDVLAIGVLRGALVNHVAVPEQLSVVGFDDIAMAAFTVPALTTVRMPMGAMAGAAVAMAIGAQGARMGWDEGRDAADAEAGRGASAVRDAEAGRDAGGERDAEAERDAGAKPDAEAKQDAAAKQDADAGEGAGQLIRRGRAVVQLFRPELVVRGSTGPCPADRRAAAAGQAEDADRG